MKENISDKDMPEDTEMINWSIVLTSDIAHNQHREHAQQKEAEVLYDHACREHEAKDSAQPPRTICEN